MMHVLAAASSTQQGDLLSRIFVFERYGELVQLLQNSGWCCSGHHWRICGRICDDARPRFCGARYL